MRSPPTILRRFTIVLAALGLAPAVGLAQRSPGGAAESRAAGEGGAAAAIEPTIDAERIVGRYCLRCHNDTSLKGGMTFEDLDLERAERHAEVVEKMIRKLRAGMMPPSTVRRPDEATLAALVEYLADRVDAEAAVAPDPGARTFQRLNRAEYARSIRELLDIDIDVAAFLPPDTLSQGFDNIADVQNLSAAVLDGYLRAAAKVSRDALGDPDAGPSEHTYAVPRTASQAHRVEGAPFGTRGGVSVIHSFPADGEYRFKVLLHGSPTGLLFGMNAPDEQVEISVDGARVALIEIDPFLNESDPGGLTIESQAVSIRAGARRVTGAFIDRAEGPVDDLIAPIEHTLADTQIGYALGITTLPHLRRFTIAGPRNVTGVSDTPARRRVFRCRPLAAAEEIPCAREILGRLATQAYRRPLDEADVEGLMRFYEQGAEGGNFEAGIRLGLQAILASPHFLLRLERVPEAAPAGAYRVGDLELASRLSYFIWAAVPDAELIELASRGTLSEPAVMEAQVRRLLADPRAEALSTRFAAQWLRLQDLDKIHPDALRYPQFDHSLAQLMRRETELLFDHIVRNDRSVLELLTADYTYVEERLARHYEIAGVAGSRFRKVRLPDERRRGLLGHAGILAMTSHANRTSPVLRGKWVLEVLLGTPPPPPPPDIPDFEETAAVVGTRALTVRERMEEHRANPACASCHNMIDPIGLALENFDVTGAWRIRDQGAPIDAAGELYDGSPLNGPAALRQALLRRADAFVAAFTESLMAYGLGRRVEYHDMPVVRAVMREAKRHDHRLSAFILGVVNSPAFQMNKMIDAAGADPETDGR